MATDRDRTIALAGIFQASALTQDLARRGRCDEQAFAASVSSLFAFDAPTTETVYGGIRSVGTGLRAVYTRMATQAEISDFELGRYVQTLMQLAGRLQTDRERSNSIQQRIGSVIPKYESLRDDAPVDDVPVPDSALCQSLAEIYSGTISTMSPQIIVHGEHGHLSDDATVSQVRTALLCGIRSAWLWQQTGGRKWHLILQRRRYIDAAGSLLAEAGLPTGV